MALTSANFAFLEKRAPLLHRCAALADRSFAGAAAGETFNHQGKTDILVRVNGKNTFMFNRNRDFSAVLRQIPEIVRSHLRFVRKEPSPLEGSFRAVLARADDPDQRVWLTVLPFEVPR